MLKNNRNTYQRDVVLTTIKSMTNHPTADQVYDIIKEEHPGISRATVYRNLNLLSEKGVILKVEMTNGADVYDFNIEKHYHLKCSSCSYVFDVDLPSVVNEDFMVAETDGFMIDGYAIVFKGICPSCNRI